MFKTEESWPMQHITVTSSGSLTLCFYKSAGLHYDYLPCNLISAALFVLGEGKFSITETHLTHLVKMKPQKRSQSHN